MPNPGTGIYSVSKIAAVALMEQLRSELRDTNIGTTCFVPGNTTSNLRDSEDYRPDELRNEAAALASRTKRAWASLLCAICGSINLTATADPKVRCSARHTLPMPPCPMRDTS